MNVVNRWLQPPRLHIPHAHVEKKASWLELFYDLIYVAAFIQLGNHLAADVSIKGALGFAALFLPLWTTWTSFTFYANRFNSDDARHRALVFIQMFGIGGMAVSIEQVYAGDTLQFAACYLLVRLMLVAMYRRAWVHEKRSREMSRQYTIGFSLGAAFWALSAVLSLGDSPDLVYLVWAIALVIDTAVPLTRKARSAALRYPPDVLHMAERYGILTIIVLGESFVKMLSEIAERGSTPHLVYMAGLGLILSCSVWWLYFDDVAGSRIKAKPLAPVIWVYSHMPFHLAVTAAGVGIKKAVYFKFDEPAKIYYAVLLCGALALAFLMVAAIDSVTQRRIQVLKDSARVNFRLASAGILLLLIPVATLMPGAVFLTLLAIMCVAQVFFDLSMAPHAANPLEHDHHAQEVFDELALEDADDEDDGEQQATPVRRDVGEAVRKGTPNDLRRDLYFHLMEASWTQVLVGVAVAYLLGNVVFAALFMLDPTVGTAETGVAGVHIDSFADAFFFSVQTMSSIGYGVMAPASTWAHTLVTIEAALSLIAVALVTGLMFAKASRPQAGVLFSEPVIVAPRNGVLTLEFRAGNARGNDIVEATMRVTALLTEVSAEGQKLRRLHDLKLMRERTPLFVMSWSVFHTIDEDSPLYGMSPAFLQEQEGFLLVCTLTGHDTTYGQTTHARRVYHPEDFLFEHRFVDVISKLADGRLMVDYDKFHGTVPVDED